jgi:hypothetical protein
MKHGTVRKLTRAATLSLLVFATTSGVAGLDVMAASPAMAASDDPGGGSAPAPAPGPSAPSDPGAGLLGGLPGGSGASAR